MKPKHDWLQPQYQEQVKCLKQIGFDFLDDANYLCEPDELEFSLIGQWKNVEFFCFEFGTLNAIIDGGLYCYSTLEIPDIIAKVPEIKKELDAVFLSGN